MGFRYLYKQLLKLGILQKRKKKQSKTKPKYTPSSKYHSLKEKNVY